MFRNSGFFACFWCYINFRFIGSVLLLFYFPLLSCYSFSIPFTNLLILLFYNWTSSLCSKFRCYLFYFYTIDFFNYQLFIFLSSLIFYLLFLIIFSFIPFLLFFSKFFFIILILYQFMSLLLIILIFISFIFYYYLLFILLPIIYPFIFNSTIQIKYWIFKGYLFYLFISIGSNIIFNIMEYFSFINLFLLFFIYYY